MHSHTWNQTVDASSFAVIPNLNDYLIQRVNQSTKSITFVLNAADIAKRQQFKGLNEIREIGD